MELHDQNVLLFTRGTQHGGTENVVVQLCKILSTQVNKVIVCSAKGFDLDILDKMKIRHYEISDVSSKSINTFFRISKTLYEIVKTEKITIVHTHHRAAAFYTRLLLYKHKFIFINTSHNIFDDKRIVTYWTYKKAHLITCGEAVKNNLIDVYKIEERKITVIHNAVEKYRGNIEEEATLTDLKDSGKFLVGNIGRLTQQKGIEDFVYSYLLLPDELKGKIHYIIVGDGELKDKIIKQISSFNIERYVTYLGYRKNIMSILSQIDLIVLCSLWEGLPLILIEAFSMKKTVVATSIESNIEIVKDRHNGLLVKPSQPKEIAEKIAEIVKNMSLKKQLEIHAYESYINNFDYDTYASKIIRFYNSIVSYI